jgi:hypothetical protein
MTLAWFERLGQGTAWCSESKPPGGGKPQLARIYILTGEPNKAIDQLEALLKMPYYLSPAWLRIDPNFDPIRTNPRFKKPVEGITPAS